MLLYSHTHRCDYSASNSCWIGFDFFLLFFLVLFFVFLFVPDGFRWKREIYMRSDSGYVSNKIFSPCCWALIRNIDCFWIRFWIYFFLYVWEICSKLILLQQWSLLEKNRVQINNSSQIAIVQIHCCPSSRKKVEFFIPFHISFTFNAFNFNTKYLKIAYGFGCFYNNLDW